MFAYLWLALIALFILVVWLDWRVLRLLRERHNGVWTQLGKPTLIWNNSIANSLAVLRFVWSGEPGKLGDRELSVMIGFLRCLQAAYLGVFLLAIATFPGAPGGEAGGP